VTYAHIQCKIWIKIDTPIWIVTCIEWDYRRGLDWWLGLLDSLISIWLHFTVYCHTLASIHSHVFTSRCSVAASNGGRSPSSGFTNCPRAQLPTSHSNSLQWLNCSSPLTHYLTNQLNSTHFNWLKSQSRSYFTTGDLPPISSFCSQAPWGSGPEVCFATDSNSGRTRLYFHPTWGSSLFYSASPNE
jgi:hypothetical protein